MTLFKRPVQKPAFFCWEGVTLIELVIVLLVLAILSATATPVVINALKQSQLNACTEKFASHLRYARRLVMERKTGLEEVSLPLNPDGSWTVCIGSCSSAIFEQDPLDTSRTLDSNTALKGCEGFSWMITEIPVGTNNRAIRFNPQGVPTDTYNAPLAGSALFQLGDSAGRRGPKVYVLPQTGGVLVEGSSS